MDIWRPSLQEFLVINLIHCKFVHFNQNHNEIFANLTENLPFAPKVREENFWYKKPRYSEVRVITRRVIARYDCSYNLSALYLYFSFTASVSKSDSEAVRRPKC